MPFNIALSGLQAASSDLAVVGNNIANAGTTGFKQSRAEFSDVYAAGALGGGSTSIGTGVRLSSVSQQFSQGNINQTENNLDLAISGQGFFRLNDAGSIVYTRAGAFGVDREGYVVNSSAQRLTGFEADALGNITGTQGDIQISTANLSPRETSTVTATLNLDSASALPTASWLGTSTFGGQSPATNTYNNLTSVTVYDTLGNSHVLSGYFIKTSVPNNWDFRPQIDGVDVTTAAPKANSVNTSAGVLTVSGALTPLASGDLTLNGTSIGATAADGLSTTDDTASGVAIATAINLQTGTTGVTATVQPTSLNLGAFIPGLLSGSQFQINGQNVVVGSANETALLSAINALTGSTGVTAASVSGDITLTATDGRNIQVTSDGTSILGSFGNFALTQPGDSVQRSSVQLTSTAPIIIAGAASTNAGLTDRIVYAPYKVVFNDDGTFNATASDTIDISWTPLDENGNLNGADAPQAFTIGLSTSTQYGTDFAVQAMTQNGFTTGRLNGLDVDTSGVLFGRYTNGQSLALGQVALVNFANAQGLQSLGDTAWGESFSSGEALIGAPGTGSLGFIQSGALEESNVTLTDELVALIVAQRGFQANAQTIRTADAVTQTIINLR